MISPEVVTAIGGALAATLAAALGGKKGGESSLNGFKEEVRGRFDGVDDCLTKLTKTDGAHEETLAQLTRIVERRCLEVATQAAADVAEEVVSRVERRSER